MNRENIRGEARVEVSSPWPDRATNLARVPMAFSAVSAITVVSVVSTVMVVAGVMVFALADVQAARRLSRRWREFNETAITRGAAQRVQAAREEMTRAVDAHEAALRALSRGRHPSAHAGVGPDDGAPAGSGTIRDRESDAGEVDDGEATVLSPAVGNAFPPVDLERLEHRRTRAREELLDAQRLWESVRPRHDTASRANLWIGRGSHRAWQLGPIGFERTTIRCDHLLDPECWVVREYRRPRFGLGLGAESASLVLFAAAVDSARLGALVGAALSGPDVALRPGFAPYWWWRRRRRTGPALRAMLSVRSDTDLSAPPSPATIEAVRTALGDEFGVTIDHRGLPGMTEPTVAVHRWGPALLIGSWWGPQPAERRCAASAHTIWWQ